MPRYRERSPIVDAVKWDTGLSLSVAKWLGDAVRDGQLEYGGEPTGFPSALIATGTGVSIVVNPGDWIVRSPNGSLYPYKPDQFEAMFEPVEV